MTYYKITITMCTLHILYGPNAIAYDIQAC